MKRGDEHIILTCFILDARSITSFIEATISPFYIGTIYARSLVNAQQLS